MSNVTPADFHLMVYRAFVSKVGRPMSDYEQRMLDGAKNTWDTVAMSAEKAGLTDA